MLSAAERWEVQTPWGCCVPIDFIHQRDLFSDAAFSCWPEAQQVAKPLHKKNTLPQLGA